MQPKFYCPETVIPGLTGVNLKKSYKTKEEALRAGNINTKVYHCRSCGNYHIHSKKKKKYRRF